jgi:uncharacterized protein YecE (DUF72 family)
MIVVKPSPPSETGMATASPSGNAFRAAAPACSAVRQPLNESNAMMAFILWQFVYSFYATYFKDSEDFYTFADIPDNLIQ